MKRVLLSFIFVNTLSISNVVLSQQQQGYYNNQTTSFGNNPNNNQNNNQNTGNNYNQYGPYSTQNTNNNQNIANVSYNNQIGNYNNNQVNNNNKGNKQKRSNNNPFLNNYVLKNNHFSADVFKMNGGLYKTTIGNTLDRNGNVTKFDNELKKSIVIFFGDWCPHCAKFLGNLSKYINQLTSSGIKIIFISVPSIERIQTWQDPSMADYNESKNKLRNFGIDVDRLNLNQVELVLLGNNDVLEQNSIDSLPKFIAIRNGTEQFRGGSDNSLDVLNFDSTVTMQQFQEIWYEDDEDEYEEDEEEEEDDDDEEEEEEKPKKKVKKKNKSTKKKSNNNSNKKKIIKSSSNKKIAKKKITKAKTTKSKGSKVDKQLASFHTNMLNKGYMCNCSNTQQTQTVVKPPVTYVQVPVQTQTVQYIQQPVMQTQPVKYIQQPVLQPQPVKYVQQPVKTQPVVQTAPVTTIQSKEVDENFIEDETPTRSTSGRRCIKQKKPVMCSSRLKQRREKIHNKIEEAIEKREKNTCPCPN